MLARTAFLLLLTTALNACFLFKDYKKKEFAYTQNAQAQILPIIVPKGYVKEEAKDTAGIRLYTFHYPDGALLYAAYLTDTTYELQSFNKALHQPKPIGINGLVYKGQDADDLFYREIRQGNLRFGYRNVPAIHETYFDSATNYAVLQGK